MKDLSASTYFLLILSYTLMGYATSSYAARKNKNKKIWFALGFLFGILALLALYIIPKQEEKLAIEPPKVEPKEPSMYSNYLWYYLDHTHSSVGPMSFEAFKKSYQEAKINKDQYIWSELLQDWAILSSQPKLLQDLE